MSRRLGFIGISIVLVLLFSITGVVAADGQNGTTLSATITSDPSWTVTYHWTIDKSVIPATLDMFKGDTGSVEYTVAVTKDGGTVSADFSGQVCVTNGGAVDTQDLAITVDLTLPPDQTVIASTSVDVSGNPVIVAGDTKCYDFSITGITPQDLAGATYKLTANVTITDHSGHLNTPFGPSPSDSGLFPANPTLINNSINVDDTNGGSWGFSDSGSASYSKSFTCNDDEGQHNNTATIRETGASDSASVTVNCYSLAVSKNAATSFSRTYSWNIGKNVTPTTLTLALNEIHTVNYTATLSMTGYVDSDFAVSGSISVHNPAPIDATLNSVSDDLDGIGSISVSCGVDFPYTLAAGATLNCTYSSPLPDTTTRTNTATAVLQNTPSGTTSFSGSASVNFAGATMSQIDECVSVSDTQPSSTVSGTYCVGDSLPKVWHYSATVGPYFTCGNYNVPNTASLVTNDRGVIVSSSANVSINVPCGGCTLTIGYWKNHAGFGPQRDMLTPLLPQWLGSPIPLTKSIHVITPGQAVVFLSFNGSNLVFDASNGINKLYAQLLAAKLNIANGASGAAVSSTMASADFFLMTHNSLDWAGLSKANKNQVLTWAATFDNFNNGLIGPGHCSE